MTKKTRDDWNEWARGNPNLFKSVERIDDPSQINIIAEDISKKLNLKEEDRLLDIGCGSGLLLAELVKKKKISALGIDFSEEQIRIACKNFPHIKFIVADIEEMNFKKRYFNKILCYGVFHYFENWKKVINKFIDIVDDKGIILIGDIPDKRFIFKFHLYQLRRLFSLIARPSILKNKIIPREKRASWRWVDLDKICRYIEKSGLVYNILVQPENQRQYGIDTGFYRRDLLIYKNVNS